MDNNTYNSYNLPAEYGKMLGEICRGRECKNCLLKGPCPRHFTVTAIQEAWETYFGKTCDISPASDSEFMAVLKGD